MKEDSFFLIIKENNIHFGQQIYFFENFSVKNNALYPKFSSVTRTCYLGDTETQRNEEVYKESAHHIFFGE